MTVHMSDLAPAPSQSPPASLISGSVFFTLLYCVTSTALALGVWFFVQLPLTRSWTPLESSGVTSLRVSNTLKGRFRLVAAAVRASDAEVVNRCGPDAHSYLQLTRWSLYVVLGASLPAMLGLLPLALSGGGGMPHFGRSTLQNVVPAHMQPCLWAVLLCAVVNVACLMAATQHLEAELGTLPANARSPAARCTLLLRGLPRRASRERGQLLLSLLRRRFGQSVLRVYAHTDRRRERRLAGEVAVATGERRAVLEQQLARVRAMPQKGAGIAFAVFDSPVSCNAALAALRERRLLLRGTLGEIADLTRWRLGARAGTVDAYDPPLRAEPAPAPDALLWQHVGLGPVGRAARTVAVNIALLCCCAVMSSPAILLVVAFDAAASPGSVDSPSRWWQRTVMRPHGHGAVQGFLLQFVPSCASLLIMTYALPYLFQRAAQAECHLSMGGYRQALLSKSFLFNVLNVVFVLGFGRAALAALVQRARDCDWARDNGVSDCTQSFVLLLERLWIDNSVASAMGLLSIAASISIAVSLLNWRLLAAHLLRQLHAARSGLDASLIDVSDDMYTQSRLLRWLAATPDTLVFSIARDQCMLACALTFGVLAPCVLLPGLLYFAFLYAAAKWQLMSGAAAPMPTGDSRLSRAAVHTMRQVMLVHVTATVFLLYERGGRVQATLLLLVDLALVVQAAFHALFSSSARPAAAVPAPDEPWTMEQATLLQQASKYAGDAALEEGDDDAQGAGGTYTPPAFQFA